MGERSWKNIIEWRFLHFPSVGIRYEIYIVPTVRENCLEEDSDRPSCREGSVLKLCKRKHVMCIRLKLFRILSTYYWPCFCFGGGEFCRRVSEYYFVLQ